MEQREKDYLRERGFSLTEGVFQCFTLYFVIGLIVLGILYFTLGYFRVGYDGTDNQASGERSGVELRTDYGTGCQYLETSKGALIPRTNPSGKQICVAIN